MFNPDGSALADQDTVFRPVTGGLEEDVNAWMAKAAALPGGGFLIGGIYAASDAQRWQAFTQRMSTAGEPVGETIRVHAAPEISQAYIDMGVLADGSARIGYTSEPDEGNAQAVLTGLASESEAPDPQPPVSASEEGSSGSSVAFGTRTPYMAFTADTGSFSRIGLVPVMDLSALPTPFYVGRSGKYSHTPDIAAGPTGGVLAYFELVSGFRNDLILHWFAQNESGFFRAGTHGESEYGKRSALPTQPDCRRAGFVFRHLGRGRQSGVSRQGTFRTLRGSMSVLRAGVRNRKPRGRKP